MKITLPLEKISIEEKIQAMEAILNNLCKKTGSLSSTFWYKNILCEREKRVKNGDDEFIYWDKVCSMN